MTELLIRPARLEDAPQLAALLTSIVAAGGYTIMEEQTDDEQRAFIAALTPRTIYNVAVMDDTIVGVQEVFPPAFPLKAIYHVGEIGTFVALNQRGGGIGQALFDYTSQQAITLGYRKLIAMIRADNANGLAYYSKLGFRTIGVAQQHAFVDGKYIGEVFTEKQLL